MTPDPLGGDVSNPQSLNRYAYVLNNPTTLIDPSGLGPADSFCMNNPHSAACGGDAAGSLLSGFCTMDAIAAPCVAVQAALGAGFACPGSCTTAVTGSNGLPYTIVQTAGPTVYVAPNGEELSDASIAELGLPPIGSSEGMGIGNPFIPDSGGTGGGSGTAGCTTRILGAVNQTFGTSFTSSNVQNTFSYNGAFNLVIAGQNLAAVQFNAISSLGRFPLNPLTYFIGYGATLHLTGPGSFDPRAQFSNSNVGGVPSVTFTAHTDSAFAYNPIGLVFHFAIDVLGRDTRAACP